VIRPKFAKGQKSTARPLHLTFASVYIPRLEFVPESRLPPAMIGAIILPIGVFWFGWTSRESIHWIVPILGTGLFSMGVFFLFQAGLKCVSCRARRRGRVH
jgi:drug/metabolite transporter (DMT)-like permease